MSTTPFNFLKKFKFSHQFAFIALCLNILSAPYAKAQNIKDLSHELLTCIDDRFESTKACVSECPKNSLFGGLNLDCIDACKEDSEEEYECMEKHETLQGYAYTEATQKEQHFLHNFFKKYHEILISQGWI